MRALQKRIALLRWPRYYNYRAWVHVAVESVCRQTFLLVRAYCRCLSDDVLVVLLGTSKFSSNGVRVVELTKRPAFFHSPA